MKPLANHLADATAPHVFGANLFVIGIVSVTDIEALLKCAVLAATLVLTCISAWLKWRHRDKPRD